ncbi:P-loop containing nucleoside triphosphate hydrolase protein [Pavlovales sp. CCMP2436]|nr:P-loop containing nucleoside triphosphate hydrolase protein [Pavlovales sp. CCMP2436]
MGVAARLAQRRLAAADARATDARQMRAREIDGNVAPGTEAAVAEDLCSLEAMFPTTYPSVVEMVYKEVAGCVMERAIEALLQIADDSHHSHEDSTYDYGHTPGGYASFEHYASSVQSEDDTPPPPPSPDPALALAVEHELALERELAELRVAKALLEETDSSLHQQLELVKQELEIAGKLLAATDQRAEECTLVKQELEIAGQLLLAAEARADEFARKYVSEFFLRKKLHNQLQEMLGNLRVYCRVRPPSAHELEQDVVGDKNGHTTVEVPNNETLLVSDKEDPKRPRRRYDYSKVYGPASTQEEVFSDTEPLMTSVLDGYNVCVFAYGQSGSGKTYTMEGTADSPGLALRAVDALFLGAEERRAQGYETELSIGLVEIYNETLGDLLADPTEDHSHKKLEILKDASLGMYVRDLHVVPVDSAARVRELVNKGNEHRRTAATGLNEHSSRSHMVVSIICRTTNAQSGESWVGKLSLVDLAGSERLCKSEVTGEVAKDSIAINQSLTSLGSVIAALANGEKHVPYRDSKLTYLLQDSLGGNSKTLMFVNVSPAQLNVKETLNSLAFANRAKSVALGKATRNQVRAPVEAKKK